MSQHSAGKKDKKVVFRRIRGKIVPIRTDTAKGRPQKNKRKKEIAIKRSGRKKVKNRLARGRTVGGIKRKVTFEISEKRGFFSRLLTGKARRTVGTITRRLDRFGNVESITTTGVGAKRIGRKRRKQLGKKFIDKGTGV